MRYTAAFFFAAEEVLGILERNFVRYHLLQVAKSNVIVGCNSANKYGRCLNSKRSMHTISNYKYKKYTFHLTDLNGCPCHSLNRLCRYGNTAFGKADIHINIHIHKTIQTFQRASCPDHQCRCSYAWPRQASFALPSVFLLPLLVWSLSIYFPRLQPAVQCTITDVVMLQYAEKSKITPWVGQCVATNVQIPDLPPKQKMIPSNREYKYVMTQWWRIARLLPE